MGFIACRFSSPNGSHCLHTSLYISFGVQLVPGTHVYLYVNTYITIYIYAFSNTPSYVWHGCPLPKCQDSQAPQLAPDAFSGLEKAAERRQADKTAKPNAADGGSTNQNQEAQPIRLFNFFSRCFTGIYFKVMFIEPACFRPLVNTYIYMYMYVYIYIYMYR